MLIIIIYGIQKELILSIFDIKYESIASSIQIVPLIISVPISIFLGTIIEGLSSLIRPFPKVHYLEFNTGNRWITFLRMREEVLFHTKFRKFLKFYFGTTVHLLGIIWFIR